MTTTGKIRMLLGGCLLLVLALSGIQYYLVRNTYELTKRQYETDIRQAISQVSPTYVDSANQQMMRQLIRHIGQPLPRASLNPQWVYLLAHQQMSRHQREQQRLAGVLRREPLLQGVSYWVEYSQILLQWGDQIDTLLGPTDRPALILGQMSATTEHLLISRGEQVSSFACRSGYTAQSETCRLAIQYRQQMDITRGHQRILGRMSHILLAAIGLLVAVILLFYGVFRTLFRQKRLADILTDFTNNMTHELKTPLTSMAIIVKSLKNPLIRQQPVVVDELVQSLERQQQRLHQLTDQVLASSLIAQTGPSWQEIDIDAFLMEVVLDFKTDTHRLTTRLTADSTWVKTDPLLLRSVIDNLLDNARKYSPVGSDIQVKSERTATSYLISVTDQGVGIAPRYQQAVFTKFYRIPERDVHTVKGLGLGLYLCQTQIRQLGGHLWLQSALGLGSTFFIQIPIHGTPHFAD